LGTESAPAPQRTAQCFKIIIRPAPCLQGETFTGLSRPQRKFSGVASVHHFLCLLGGDLQRGRLGDRRNPIADSPIT
jgi:hypothetical protein